MNLTSAGETVRSVRAHDHIHISSVAQIPHYLIEALSKRADPGGLTDVYFHFGRTGALCG